SPRSSEPFPRVYSAPDPPKPPRRSRAPRALAWLVAAASFVAAAAGVFLFLAPGGGDRSAAPRSTGIEETSPPAATSAPPSSAPPSASSPPAAPSAPALIAALPAPCSTLPAGVVRDLVPSARRTPLANPILTTCTYTAMSGSPRWLTVEATLYRAADYPAPLDNARRFFASRLSRDARDVSARTVSQDRRSGLGDEAFRLFKIDKDQPVVVGQVTFRVRNAVLTISYIEQHSAKERPEALKAGCLAKATRAAGEVRASFR
ncbi:hypothetical protein, partial [Actinomadura parmotrematis]